MIIRTFFIKKPNRYNYYHDIVCDECGIKATVCDRSGIRNRKTWCKKCSLRKSGEKRKERGLFKCSVCGFSKELKLSYIKRNKHGMCNDCYQKSDAKKIAMQCVVGTRRDYKGSSNPNFKDKTKIFTCSCGQEFSRCVSPSAIRDQGMPKFCSNSCKRRYSVSKAKYIIYNEVKYRSSWEVALAKWFDKNRVVFQYEPESFETPFGYYTPDFYVPAQNMYYEVKGYFRDENAKNKFNFFAEKHAITLADQKYLESIGLVRIKSGPKKNEFCLPEEILCQS